MNIARPEEPSSSTVTNKALRGIGLLVVVLLIGTFGYMIIEDWSLLDALYMTVITITTVGYGEIHNVDEAGRIFTIILIFMGMGSVAYTAGVMAQAMVEGQLQLALGRRRLGQKIKGLKDHYIICGYGRIGRVIINELKSHGIPLVVVDSNPELKGGMEHEMIPFIIDDATSEDVLLEAGVERAKGLVAVVLSDADNLFITMTARLLNQNLFILSRADEEATQRKLLRAGANRVVMPYLIGGQKMAQTIVRPAVTDFLEVTVHDKGIELKMEELVVGEKSRLNGVMLMDSKIRQEMNIMIVAIRKRSGQMIFNPSSQAKIEAGDILIALGHTTELERLVEILAG
jgi:voltage-gated potassium channel